MGRFRIAMLFFVAVAIGVRLSIVAMLAFQALLLKP